MTSPSGQIDETRNKHKQNQLHQWATDLSGCTARIIGTHPHDAIANMIMRIAAEMEEKAAQEYQGMDNSWQSTLYRSAGWMYVKGANHKKMVLQDATRCADTALSIGGPRVEKDVQQLKKAIAEMSDTNWTQPEAEPWITCCKCKRHISFSKHQPRQLTANEIDLEVVVAQVCSRCEWLKIIQTDTASSGENERAPIDAKTIDLLYKMLSEQGRKKEAEYLDASMVTTTQFDNAEKIALQIAVQNILEQQDQTAEALIEAIDNGKLVSFGLLPKKGEGQGS